MGWFGFRWIEDEGEIKLGIESGLGKEISPGFAREMEMGRWREEYGTLSRTQVVQFRSEGRNGITIHRRLIGSAT